MNLNYDEAKRQELISLLRELAKAQDLLEEDKSRAELLGKLKKVYEDPNSDSLHRHYYSDIFGVISQIDMGVVEGETETLSQNMEILKSFCEAECSERRVSEDFLKSIRKLYDHINLDVARLTYFTQNMGKTKSELSNIETKIAQMDKSQEKISEDIEETRSMGKNYITILGIFASIVLAFTGGLAFSTSVLENINAISPIRLTAVVIGLAFILINTVYILTRFIQEINKTRGEKIKTPNFVWAVNGILIVAMGITLYVHFSGILNHGSQKQEISETPVQVSVQANIQENPQTKKDAEKIQ